MYAGINISTFPGVRYYVRGVDDEGHAANFVETEQLVVYEGIVSSFVQVSIMFVIQVLAVDRGHLVHQLTIVYLSPLVDTWVNTTSLVSETKHQIQAQTSDTAGSGAC